MGSSTTITCQFYLHSLYWKSRSWHIGVGTYWARRLLKDTPTHGRTTCGSHCLGETCLASFPGLPQLFSNSIKAGDKAGNEAKTCLLHKYATFEVQCISPGEHHIAAMDAIVIGIVICMRLSLEVKR